MILLEPDKMRARIHMGAPVLGVQDSGFALGYRFNNTMGLLEYRMNHLQPHEYARIVGVPVAALALFGSPALGNTLSIAVNGGSPYVYTVKSSDMSASDAMLSVVTNAANGFNSVSGSTIIASQQPSVVFPVTTIAPGPPQWQMAFVANTQASFTISVSTTGGMISYVVLQGALPYPQHAFSEDNLTVYGYLGICDYLQSKIASASDLSPKYAKADVVDFNRDELRIRESIYKNWRQKLADWLGIPLYPQPPTQQQGGSMGTGLVI